MRGAGTFSTLEIGLWFLSPKILDFLLLSTIAGKKSNNFELAGLKKIISMSEFSSGFLFVWVYFIVFKQWLNLNQCWYLDKPASLGQLQLRKTNPMSGPRVRRNPKYMKIHAKPAAEFLKLSPKWLSWVASLVYSGSKSLLGDLWTELLNWFSESVPKYFLKQRQSYFTSLY